jgi:hypothetical protein
VKGGDRQSCPWDKTGAVSVTRKYFSGIRETTPNTPAGPPKVRIEEFKPKINARYPHGLQKILFNEGLSTNIKKENASPKSTPFDDEISESPHPKFA